MLSLSSLTPLLARWHFTTSVQLVMYFNASEKRMKPDVFQTKERKDRTNRFRSIKEISKR